MPVVRALTAYPWVPRTVPLPRPDGTIAALVGLLWNRGLLLKKAAHFVRKRMNKKEFDRQKQLLFVYLRRNRKCAICGGEVNPQEITTDRDILAPLQIDDLLQVQLVHPFCEAKTRREGSQLAA